MLNVLLLDVFAVESLLVCGNYRVAMRLLYCREGLHARALCGSGVPVGSAVPVPFWNGSFGFPCPDPGRGYWLLHTGIVGCTTPGCRFRRTCDPFPLQALPSMGYRKSRHQRRRALNVAGKRLSQELVTPARDIGARAAGDTGCRGGQRPPVSFQGRRPRAHRALITPPARHPCIFPAYGPLSRRWRENMRWSASRSPSPEAMVPARPTHTRSGPRDSPVAKGSRAKHSSPNLLPQ